MPEANVETLKRGYDALNRGDVSQVLELIDEDIEWRAGGVSAEADPQERGRDGLLAFIRSWLDSFDDFRVEPIDVEQRGDQLIATVRQSGRGTASGVEVTIEIAHVWTIVDGRAVRLEPYANRESALAALGAGPGA